jgi:hypothetical protein
VHVCYNITDAQRQECIHLLKVLHSNDTQQVSLIVLILYMDVLYIAICDNSIERVFVH